MKWDAEDFLKKLKAGGFDGNLYDEVLRLSPEQLRAVEQLLQPEPQDRAVSPTRSTRPYWPAWAGGEAITVSPLCCSLPGIHNMFAAGMA
jgi:hypothetical protein